jgi:tetratricopeptide (TPR) repeat protein
MTTDDKGDETKDDNNNPDDLRQLGNHQFAQQNYEVAAHFYSQALELVEKQHNDTCTDPPTSLLLNLCNRSACYFQMEMYEEAKIDAERAWNYLPQLSNAKAAYRLAKTWLALGKFEQAKDIILQVIQIVEEAEVEEQKKAEVRSRNKKHDSDDDDDQDDDDPKEEKDNADKDKDDAIKTQRKAFEDLMKTLEKKQKNQGKEPPKISIRDFTIQDELGFGNFSEIYKVTHKQTGKQFALKRINKKKAKDLG